MDEKRAIHAEALDRTIATLLEIDRFFKAHWEALDDASREEFRSLHLDMACAVAGGTEELRAAHLLFHDAAKRLFSRVQQKELDETRRPRDWSSFARDPEAQRALCERAHRRLEELFRSQLRSGFVRLYGGLKSEEPLSRKIEFGAKAGPLRSKLFDFWDLVRFRLVVRDLPSACEAGMLIWDTFFDEIIRARNYYFAPKNQISENPYRALHFEIMIEPERMVELQVMTAARERVSWLDYAPLYKGESLIDTQEWLLAQSWRANIFDHFAARTATP